LTAFAFIVASRYRCVVLALGILAGLGIGLVRIAQGGHFASDVFAA